MKMLLRWMALLVCLPLIGCAQVNKQNQEVHQRVMTEAFKKSTEKALKGLEEERAARARALQRAQLAEDKQLLAEDDQTRRAAEDSLRRCVTRDRAAVSNLGAEIDHCVLYQALLGTWAGRTDRFCASPGSFQLEVVGFRSRTSNGVFALLGLVREAGSTASRRIELKVSLRTGFIHTSAITRKYPREKEEVAIGDMDLARDAAGAGLVGSVEWAGRGLCEVKLAGPGDVQALPKPSSALILREYGRFQAFSRLGYQYWLGEARSLAGSDKDALFQIGQKYLFLGERASPAFNATALEVFKAAADIGPHASSEMQIAHMYRVGLGVRASASEADKWSKRAQPFWALADRVCKASSALRLLSPERASGSSSAANTLGVAALGFEISGTGFRLMKAAPADLASIDRSFTCSYVLQRADLTIDPVEEELDDSPEQAARAAEDGAVAAIAETFLRAPRHESLRVKPLGGGRFEVSTDGATKRSVLVELGGAGASRP